MFNTDIKMNNMIRQENLLLNNILWIFLFPLQDSGADVGFFFTLIKNFAPEAFNNKIIHQCNCKNMAVSLYA